MAAPLARATTPADQAVESPPATPSAGGGLAGTQPPTGQVAGVTGSGGNTGTDAGNGNTGTDAGNGASAAQGAAGRVAQNGGGSLPFTGYPMTALVWAVLALLLVGAAVRTGRAVLARWNTGSQTS